MGLITKEVEIRIAGGNTKWYENKGYYIPREKDKWHKDEMVVHTGTKIKVNVHDLPPKSNVKIKYKCDNCGEDHETIWSNCSKSLKEGGKTYCSKCTTKLFGAEHARLSQVKNGVSFEQWCNENNHQDLLDRWDYELNKYKPNELGHSTNIKCWFKCPKGIHKSEIKNINLITSGWINSYSCIACNSIGQWLIDLYGENAIEMYWSDKNIINPFEITYGSSIKIWLKCQRCGNDKKIRFSDFIRYGFSCPKCSDGVSYPNKLAFNLLEQLGLEFTIEYSPDWIKPKRYDFYFKYNNIEYILEMDGKWHNQDNKMSGQTKEKSKEIDEYKDQLARNYGINVIRINCDISELEYIKSNLIYSTLNQLFDFSQVDWNKCNEYACNSLVKIACDLWNNGMQSTIQIAKLLKCSKGTIGKYLKQGVSVGWCNYDPKIAKEKVILNLSKKVYCFELDRVFDSTMDVQRELGIANPNISACCLKKGNHKIAGGYHWTYYEDYKNQQKVS